VFNEIANKHGKTMLLFLQENKSKKFTELREFPQRQHCLNPIFYARLKKNLKGNI
jgi:hypothetical protein